MVRHSISTLAPAKTNVSRIAPRPNNASSGWAITASTDVHAGGTPTLRHIRAMTSLTVGSTVARRPDVATIRPPTTMTARFDPTSIPPEFSPEGPLVPTRGDHPAYVHGISDRSGFRVRCWPMVRQSMSGQRSRVTYPTGYLGPSALCRDENDS